MKLSEEIILGGTLMKHSSFYNPFYDLGASVGCALQLAHVARTGASTAAPYTEMLNAHPELDIAGSCPACVKYHQLGVIIAHLNDVHEWSLDAIAEWVAGIERTLPASQPEPAEEQYQFKTIDVNGNVSVSQITKEIKK